MTVLSVSASFFIAIARGNNNVVLHMNVVLKVGFEVSQRLVYRLIADTPVARNRITTTGFAHGAQRVPRGVVLVFHHGNWILHARQASPSDLLPPQQ
jgi:hypothetical protein